MDYTTLPAGARIIDGKLFLPANAEEVVGQKLFVRLKAHGDVPAGAPSMLAVPAPVLLDNTPIGSSGVALSKVVAAVALPAFAPVAVIDWIAYPLDAGNRSHAYAFSGFTTEPAGMGERCQLRAIGVISAPAGITLIPAQHYLAGINGVLVTQEEPTAAFTRIIGFALSSNEMRVLNLPPIFRA